MKPLILFVATVLLLSFRPAARITERPDFERFFKEQKLTGSFLLYDPQRDHYTAYQFERCRKGFLPASTFKIMNTLVGLETGVLKDENSPMKWDGVKRDIEAWNQDHTLKTAFAASCVPCYQELARKIGLERMQKWVNKADYGNLDISAGNLDRFWLEGASRITQEQQVDFLRRIHEGKVPFSKRSLGILKKVMLLDEKPGYRLYGKTGWVTSLPDVGVNSVEGNTGWFVGYVEKGDKVYYFATNVESPSPAPPTFVPGRRAITEAILKEMGIL